MCWLAGRDGGNRMLVGESALRPTIGQVGHMNLIHPFRVQILGAAELAYLRALPEDELNRSINRLFTTELAAIVVGNGEQVPRHLLDMCNQHRVALVTSQQPSPHIVDVFRIYLSRVLAQSTTLHGVFLDVLELGVLITGASAIGKSELALELISRGNGLIADDIVELFRISPDTIEGRCPEVLRDFLEVRGIGILNIRTIFGETAVRPHKLLRLIVHLEDHGNEAFSDLDRLQVNATFQEVLAVPIRKVTIPVAAGRNLAVLVEAAVRNFVLNQRGIDSTKEFIERQQKLMNEGSTELRADDDGPAADRRRFGLGQERRARSVRGRRLLRGQQPAAAAGRGDGRLSGGRRTAARCRRTRRQDGARTARTVRRDDGARAARLASALHLSSTQRSRRWSSAFRKHGAGIRFRAATAR